MDDPEKLKAENTAHRETQRAMTETYERLRATILEREKLLVRLWRNEKSARLELQALVTDENPLTGIKCVLDSMS